MRPLRLALGIIVLAAVGSAPSPVAAQAPDPAVGVSHPGWQAQPSQFTAAAALRPATSAADTAAQPDNAAVVLRGSRHEGSVLMIVGLAGLVTGLIVDEDIITIAGAGVAGVGLYLYLR